jgi:nitroreductase
MLKTEVILIKGGKDMNKKLNIFVIFLIIINIFSILTLSSSSVKKIDTEIFLTPPLSVNMTYRDAIFSRCSVRNFKVSPQMKYVEDEKLSTILWAAYGYRDDGTRTVSSINNEYSTVIYVFREEAVYKYNPLNHSLVFYEDGDLRRTVNWQHRAPIQLGLVWDKNKNKDENYSSIEIGQIGQNIYFMARALGLGTVTAGLTGFDEIDLPDNEVGRIVMPLGYPQKILVFEYEPNIISFLPKIQDSIFNLKTVIKERKEENSFNGTISRQDLSQLLWSSYGFSYLIDKTDTIYNEVKRHRTVPSAGCVYPLEIYAITKSGIFRYFPHILHLNPYSDNSYYSTNWELPVISFLIPIRLGDYRLEISEASSQPDISSAPLIIIPVLPNPSVYTVSWYWYYEAGSSAHNIMLESTILDLHAGIVKPNDLFSIKSILRLNEDSLPLILVPVGE